MPTVKDVIYKILEKQNPPYAWYYQSRRRQSTIPNETHITRLFKEECVFWTNEISSTNIPTSELRIVLQELYKASCGKDFVEYFEHHFLPVLLKYKNDMDIGGF